ncbi:flagellar FlbD family protein [Citrobacter sp. Awk 4]|uniref:flagellar FlbD family protein n=1 Tax=Citrobacter sp. Awk 4 TaxID=2963955 RepID=UPI003FA41296
MIIQLTDRIDDVIFINTDHIIFINPRGDYTAVRLIENVNFNVKESASDIVDTINSCSK